jgi:hypothetical protein
VKALRAKNVQILVIFPSKKDHKINTLGYVPKPLSGVINKN